MPLAFEIGELSVVLFVSAWLGLAYLKLGRRDEARHVLERGLRWGETRPAVTRADDRVEGRRLIERARAIFDEIGAPGWSSEAEAALNPAA